MRDIVTLAADKGRSTVVMDKTDYTTKLQSLLEDEGAYELSETEEFKKHVNSVNRAIDKLRKAGALKRNEALTAKATDAAMARFYGLSKVHKPGVPLHPTVFLRDTSTFGLSKWPYQRFRFLTEGSEWTVESAEEFLKSIRNLEVEPDETIVSFNVVSLFMSIPTGLAINTIDELLREKYDDADQQLKRTHITELLELCLRTFFTFGDRVYKQEKGTRKGSPLSGLIAEARTTGLPFVLPKILGQMCRRHICRNQEERRSGLQGLTELNIPRHPIYNGRGEQQPIALPRRECCKDG
nr:unnamed protein product [Spirometra erinaceieuropaei]